MDVGEWLRGLGLGQYEDRFRDNRIDAEVLPQLTADDLREIGVAAVGDRRKLLAAIAALAARSPSAYVQAHLSTAQPKPLEVSAERRPVAVMFCDLVGSTSLAAKLDAEDWRNLVNTYLGEACKAVIELGGHVLKKCDTMLAQIVQMVAEAQKSRAPIQRLADQVSGWFVPLVIAIALLAFAAWAIWGPEPAL